MPSIRQTLFAAIAALSFALPAWGQDVRAQDPHLVTVQVVEPTLPASWVTIEGPFVQVHGPPQQDALLRALSEHAERSILRLAEDLDVPVGGTVHVHLAQSDEEFRSLQPGRSPTWADGVAYPGQGLIYLRDPSIRGGTAKPLTQVLDHELVHILLGRAFAPVHPPSWLQEGVAQVWSGEYTPEIATRITRGTVGRSPMSLDSLAAGFPRDPVAADLAYAQSADLIAWMQVTYGKDVVQTLVKELAAEKDIHAAVYNATGELLEVVDRKWRARLQSTSFGITDLASEQYLWALGGFLLLAGGVMRRRRFLRRLQEMEDEERLVDELVAGITGRPVGPPPSDRWDPRF